MATNKFSIIKKNCYIPPHCDTENKLLSLMVYLPPENNTNNLELGTNETVFIKGQKSPYRVSIYRTDYPEYIPYV